MLSVLFKVDEHMKSELPYYQCAETALASHTVKMQFLDHVSLIYIL